MPIALVEALAGDLADRPWLTRHGLAWAVMAVVLGGAATVGITLSEDDFVPSSAQFAGAAVAVTALVALAGVLARTPPRRASRPVGGGARAEMPPELARSRQPLVPAGAAPEPRRVAAAAVVAALLFVAGAAQIGSALAVVAIYLVVVAWGVTAVRRWSARPGWPARHRLALAAGALVRWCPTWHSPWRNGHWSRSHSGWTCSAT